MKLLKILFVFILVMSLVGCSDSGQQTKKTSNNVVSVQIIQTEILADGVENSNGYGSIVLNDQTDNKRKVALIDENGEFYFPYTESKLNYKYSEGLVSLAPAEYDILKYANEEDASKGISIMPKYFINKKEIKIDNLINGGSVHEGLFYVLVGDDFSNAKLQIINNKGKKIYELDENFSPSTYDDGNYVDVSTDHGYINSIHGFLYYPLFDKIPMYRKWNDDGYLIESGFLNLNTGKLEKIDNSDGKYAASGFRNGLAIVGKETDDGNIFGTINRNGDMVLPLEYSDFTYYGEYWVVEKTDDYGNKLYGVIDDDGNFIIPVSAEYKYIGCCSDGLFCVTRDSFTCGMVNSENEIVIPFQYNGIASCDEGAIVVCDYGDKTKYGVVNFNNETIVPLEYDCITPCDNGVMYAIKDGYLSIIKCKYGKQITNLVGQINIEPLMSLDELCGTWYDDEHTLIIGFDPLSSYFNYYDIYKNQYLFDFEIKGDKLTFVPAKISGENEETYESTKDTIERFEGNKFVCTLSKRGKKISFANDENNSCFISNEGYGKEDGIEFSKLN